MENGLAVPLWRQYTMTIEEASRYFRIGQTRLRSIVDEDPTADYILWNGNRALIKRKKFEEFIDKAASV